MRIRGCGLTGLGRQPGNAGLPGLVGVLRLVGLLRLVGVLRLVGLLRLVGVLRLVGLLGLVGLGLVGVLGLAGCGGGTSASGPGSAAGANRAAGVQSIEAAEGTAQTEFGLLAGGDYGGAWGLWSDPAKQAVSQADFVARSTACKNLLGAATRIVSARQVSDGEVDVSWQRGAASGTARLVFAGGHWQFQPDQSTLDSYRASPAPSCPA